MTGTYDIAIAIRKKFQTDVAGPQNLGEVLEDNEPPPDDPRSTWYALAISWDPKEQLASGKAGKPGRATLELSMRQGTGDGAMLKLMDAVTAAFQNKPITTPIVCFEPPPHPDGEAVAFQAWYRQRMTIYFEATIFE